MSRAKLRLVLILLALILVIATVLSGLLTYWVGAATAPGSGDGEAEQMLPLVSPIPPGFRQFGSVARQPARAP
jgi:flagellar basal body-associated protein FliL